MAIAAHEGNGYKYHFEIAVVKERDPACGSYERGQFHVVLSLDISVLPAHVKLLIKGEEFSVKGSETCFIIIDEREQKA